MSLNVDTVGTVGRPFSIDGLFFLSFFPPPPPLLFPPPTHVVARYFYRANEEMRVLASYSGGSLAICVVTMALSGNYSVYTCTRFSLLPACTRY